MTSEVLIISCEHGGNTVPPHYAPLFADHQALLSTHRGWDPGALQLAQQMSVALDAPVFYATTTRLLVDLNRSIGHRQLFSEPTRGLAAAMQGDILRDFYWPHRQAVESKVARCIAAGRRVIHIASHSFTPELHGEVRRADVACLYDSRRPHERALAVRWLAALANADPALRLRRNYPYNGQGDGLASLLRKRHGADWYVGIELEVNQRFAVAGGSPWLTLRGQVIEALRAALRTKAPR